MKNEWVIHTDGGCITHLRIGAWACLVRSPDGEEMMFSGPARDTTNNQMEYRAVIEGLWNTPEGASVVVRSDSQYVIKSCTEWWKKWAKFNWQFSKNGKKIANAELLQEALALIEKRNVTFEWVRGHSGDEGNEACDEVCARLMAREADRADRELSASR